MPKAAQRPVATSAHPSDSVTKSIIPGTGIKFDQRTGAARGVKDSSIRCRSHSDKDLRPSGCGCPRGVARGYLLESQQQLVSGNVHRDGAATRRELGHVVSSVSGVHGATRWRTVGPPSRVSKARRRSCTSLSAFETLSCSARCSSQDETMKASTQVLGSSALW